MPKISSFSVTHHTDDFVEGYNQDVNLTVSSGRLGKNVDVSCAIEHLTESSVPLSSIEIVATQLEGTAPRTITLKTITPTNSLIAGQIISEILRITSLSYNESYVFAIQLKDAASRVNVKTYQHQFKRMDRPVFANQPVIIPASWDIYNSGFSIAVQDLDTSNTGPNTYALYATPQDGSKVLVAKFNRFGSLTLDQDGQKLGLVTTNLDTIIYEVEAGRAWELFKKFQIPSNANNRSVQYFVLPTNAAGIDGIEVSTSENFEIITRANTIWGSEEVPATFYNQRGYNSDNPLFTTITATTPDPDRIINVFESIKFVFNSLPSNKNETYFDGKKESKIDIFSAIEIQYALKEDAATAADDEDLIWTKFADIQYSTLKTNQLEDGSSYCQVVMPEINNQLIEIKYLAFRAITRVTGGVSSQEVTIYDNTASLVLGRVNPPSLNLAFDELHQENNYLTSANFNLLVSDFGGLKKINTKGQEQYMYDNFLRTDSPGYYSLKIYYGASLEQVQQKTYVANYDFVYFESREGQNGYVVSDTFTLAIPEDLKIATRLYYQIVVTLYPNSAQGEIGAITSINEIAAYLLSGPTMSVRRHKVGINVDPVQLEDDDEAVLIISQYNEKKIIILQSGAPENKIVIDLENRTVDGLIIDGGTW